MDHQTNQFHNPSDSHSHTNEIAALYYNPKDSVCIQDYFQKVNINNESDSSDNMSINMEDTYSTSTFSSIFKDGIYLENPTTSNQTNMNLSTIINLLKDECSIQTNFESSHIQKHFKAENVICSSIQKPIKSNLILKDDKPKVPRMDWNKYHRLNVIHAFMDDLEYNYPSICTTGAIGKSLEGRDLKILKVSNSDTTNESVWIDAGIHAREWIAPAVATYIADHITKNFDDMPASITNKDWYFLPVVNPDGYEYSHTVERMWRKNRAWHTGECVGVDLNRNFSFGWGGKGSSGIPTNVFYRGPEPFSEPESSAMRDILTNAGISFKVYITLHSYGQVIIFPYSFKEELCPDYVRLLEGATVMSKTINECNGNIYKVGISKDVMYGAAGTSYDFCYGEAGIPFCYLIELRSRQHRFKLPQEEIKETGNEILNCVKALMQFIDEKYP